jgi:hypothetical protein
MPPMAPISRTVMNNAATAVYMYTCNICVVAQRHQYNYQGHHVDGERSLPKPLQQADHTQTPLPSSRTFLTLTPFFLPMHAKEMAHNPPCTQCNHTHADLHTFFICCSWTMVSTAAASSDSSIIPGRHIHQVAGVAHIHKPHGRGISGRSDTHTKQTQTTRFFLSSHR